MVPLDPRRGSRVSGPTRGFDPYVGPVSRAFRLASALFFALPGALGVDCACRTPVRPVALQMQLDRAALGVSIPHVDEAFDLVALAGGSTTSGNMSLARRFASIRMWNEVF